MLKLSSVLIEENQREILRLASEFGFSNVQILIPFSGQFEAGKLHLVIDENREEEQYPAALQAVLQERLGCKVELIVSDNIKNIYKKEILSHCANILDGEKINDLFENRLDEIELEEYTKDIHFMRTKRLADRIIKEKADKRQKMESRKHQKIGYFMQMKQYSVHVDDMLASDFRQECRKPKDQDHTVRGIFN